jgi:dihydroorotate dehydrogenase
MSPEKAHYFTLNILHYFLKIPLMKPCMYGLFRIKAPVTFLGIEFPNCVGLAAGFDKNAQYLEEFKALGFGCVEIGTVTPLPQPGNDLPRLFRLPKDEALINRMGFNNVGADVVAQRLKNRPKELIIGGNIGKNKQTPNEDAQRDYEICFTKLYDGVDYFVVNVSSPNTPGLRDLQEKDPLKKILSALMELRKSFRDQQKPSKPILLKIAPDLTSSQLDDVIEIVTETGIDGIVATNTTLSREKLKTPYKRVKEAGAGGLSGKILFDHSTEVLTYIQDKCQCKIPMIGVGGIDSVVRAEAKLKAGASLVQLYTGFIYKGPWLVRRIARLKK